MTRKHFNMIALAFMQTRPNRDTHVGESTYQQWRTDAKAMADVCRGYNSNFDRRRFLDACGLQPAEY